MSWEGRSAVPVTTMDIFPSLMAFAGIDWEPKYPIDGRKAGKIIVGHTDERPNPIGFWKPGGGGVSTWSDKILKELHEKQQEGGPTPHLPERITGGVHKMPEWPDDQAKGHAAWLIWPWKLHRIDGVIYELYNLEDDPEEAKDLSKNSAQAERMETMKTGIQLWMQSVTASYNRKDLGFKWK